MEQNKVKFTISLPIAAVASVATLLPVSGGAQGTNAWNTNTNSLNSASSAPVSEPQEKPKYYVEPTVKTPRAIAPNGAPVETDNRFAPDNLDELLATGRNTNPAANSAVPPRPAYPQTLPQPQPRQPQQQAFAPNNMGRAGGVQNPTQNPNAYPQYGQGYGQQYGQGSNQQYGQPYSQPYGQPYGQQYGSNGYGPNANNGFPGGFNSFPGGYNNFPGNSYGGFPSMGGFPGFGSPSTNFSPFGFW